MRNVMMDCSAMELRHVLVEAVNPEPILVRDNPAMKTATSVTWILVTMMVCVKRMKTVTIAHRIALRASRPVAEMAFANRLTVKIAFPALPIAVENNQDQPKIVSVAEMVMESILSAAAIPVAHRKVLHAVLNRPLLTAAVISFVRAQKQVVIAGSIVVRLIQANVIHHHRRAAIMMACVNREKIATAVATIAQAVPEGNLPSDTAAVMASSSRRKEMAPSATEIINAKAQRR
jgi:hypothetical protein